MRCAGELVGRVAENVVEIFVGVEEGAVRMEEGEELLGGVQQRGELLEARSDRLFGESRCAMCRCVRNQPARTNTAGGGETCSLR